MTYRAFAVLALLALPPMAALGGEKRLLWGDTHLHTNLSIDAYINQNVSLGPDSAYRFARGLPVIHPTTGHRVQLWTPLDFLVVSDHAGSLGIMQRANGPGLPRGGLGAFEWLHSWLMERLYRYLASRPDGVIWLLDLATDDETDVVKAALAPPGIATPNSQRVASDAWRESIEAADANNHPGEFSAFIGWEWTSIPAGANLHRVVFTNGDADSAAQYLPFSAQQSAYPEDLWQWLEEAAARTGSDFIAIPHNSNISRGFMFPEASRLNGAPINRDWIERRARWERVVEATQVKGDSETHPRLSPDDPLADFANYPHYIMPEPVPYDPRPGDFARSGLRVGLEIERRLGGNPYRFGLIGSTDSHTGMATAEEPNFMGKFPTDSLPRDKRVASGGVPNRGWAMSAAGLAAVWAEKNTREAIFEAFKRREVYATTGPRIRVRVFASPGALAAAEPDAVDFEALAERAVPMGGEFGPFASAPVFSVRASKDPQSAHLDRIQMIKGWLDASGESRERVHDIAWSGDRQPDGSGRIPALPDTVDPATGSYSNRFGEPALAAAWRDPDFDPAQPAFYYLRVLEVHTPRHSTLDAIALGLPAEEFHQPVSIQERAYTSPIFYNP